MKIVIVLNGVSRKKKLFYSSILPALQKAHKVIVLETRRAGHAKQLAADHASYSNAILAAGGDGTLHEVLNGISATPYRPALGVIPLGSGNDFARTCKIKLQPNYLLQLLAQPPQLTDVGHIVCRDDNNKDKEEYFMNVCSAGMGPSTVNKMVSMPHWLGASGRYLGAILHTF
ncbi:MAG: diacylglycerol/lipid kinase family protein, partial [Flammeovirgaceae bacterium]